MKKEPRRQVPSVGVGVLLLFDPVVGEALLLGFFELRGDALDAKVVGVGMCLIWQGWRGKFCNDQLYLLPLPRCRRGGGYCFSSCKSFFPSFGPRSVASTSGAGCLRILPRALGGDPAATTFRAMYW